MNNRNYVLDVYMRNGSIHTVHQVVDIDIDEENNCLIVTHHSVHKAYFNRDDVLTFDKHLPKTINKLRVITIKENKQMEDNETNRIMKIFTKDGCEYTLIPLKSYYFNSIFNTLVVETRTDIHYFNPTEIVSFHVLNEQYA